MRGRQRLARLCQVRSISFPLCCLRPDIRYYFLHHAHAGAGRRQATFGARSCAERRATFSQVLTKQRSQQEHGLKSFLTWSLHGGARKLRADVLDGT